MSIKERKVIIMSTVRSSAEFVEYDIKHTLGFVASPRRFNGKSRCPMNRPYLSDESFPQLR